MSVNQLITDKLYTELYNYIAEGVQPNNVNANTFRAFSNYFMINEGKLYTSKGREVIPVSRINETLKALYSDPTTRYVSTGKLYHRCTGLYFGITRQSVGEFLKNLQTHQMHVKPHPRMITRPIIEKRKLARIQYDVIDMKPYSSENRRTPYIINAIDVFTKWGMSRPLKKHDLKHVTAALIDMFTDYGFPKTIQSDNYSTYRSEKLREAINSAATDAGASEPFFVYTTPYSPQSNGAIERFNQTLKRMIFKHFSLHKTKNWIDDLDEMLNNYNTSYHSTIRMTPTEACGDKSRKEVHSNIVGRAKYMVLRNEKITAGVTKPVRGDIVRVQRTVLDPVSASIGKKMYTVQYSRDLYRVVSSTRSGVQIQNTKATVRPGQMPFYKASDLLIVNGDNVIK